MPMVSFWNIVLFGNYEKLAELPCVAQTVFKTICIKCCLQLRDSLIEQTLCLCTATAAGLHHTKYCAVVT